jgi:signal transduction histidine kinase
MTNVSAPGAAGVSHLGPCESAGRAPPLQFLMELTVPVSRLPHLLVALAATVGALRLARSRAQAAHERIAELERETSRLTEETRRAWRIKDDFLATLSHELRTPLNAMLGWVQLLRVHSDDVEMRNHAIDVVERNARSQVQIVADMLDVSRIITGQMQLALVPVDLPRVIRSGCEALAGAAAAKNVELQIEVEPLHGDVYADATRMQQIVWNLVSNAIKFTPAGGRVVVRLSGGETHAEITVNDTGVGISPDVLPYVFDRFRQADSSLTRPFGGLGLGLAIVRHLVELHGGSVQASSAGPGTGAAFVVRLPLRRSHPRA